MRRKSQLIALLIVFPLLAQGQREFKVLHAFGAGTDGAGVWGSVAFDKLGNVYGTTSGGGNYGYGTVFQLSPQQNGQWKESLLASFKPLDRRGAEPYGGLIVDPNGRLYGTTQSGGRYGRLGTAFNLSLNGGKWVLSVIHKFGGPGDPTCCPWSDLLRDSSGNLYGTGDSVFELSPGPTKWKESILHEFAGKNGDGAGPQAGPIRDADGNLYGTTLYGGGSRVCADGCGTVWQLSPPALASGTGNWTEHILDRFGFSGNEAFPGVGQLALDPQGNLYGAVQGGKYRAGIIYRLSRVQGGSGMDETWRETVLYNFTGGADGGFPEGVILDNAGNLYGVCGVGGSYGDGTVFKLSPQSPSNWEYTLLHTFNGYDGAEPVANLTFGSNGKVYGTTATGGMYGGGVVFEITS